MIRISSCLCLFLSSNETADKFEPYSDVRSLIVTSGSCENVDFCQLHLIRGSEDIHKKNRAVTQQLGRSLMTPRPDSICGSLQNKRRENEDAG
jgi:hypothetical protein